MSRARWPLVCALAAACVLLLVWSGVGTNGTDPMAAVRGADEETATSAAALLGASGGDPQLEPAAVAAADATRSRTSLAGSVLVPVSAVLHDRAGRAVAGVEVRAEVLRPGAGSTARVGHVAAHTVSAANGSVELAVEPHRPLQLVVGAPKRVLGRSGTIVATEDGFDLGVLVVSGGPRVSGRVRTWNGAAVEGASVALDRVREELGVKATFTPFAAEAHSGTDGGFDLGPIPEGTWSVTARHPHHPPSTIELTIRPDEHLERTIDLLLRPEGTISGRVEGSAPELESVVRAGPAELTADGRRAEVAVSGVDTDGSFELRGLEPGLSYWIELRIGTSEEGLGGDRVSDKCVVTVGSSDVVLHHVPVHLLGIEVASATSGSPVERYELHVVSRRLDVDLVPRRSAPFPEGRSQWLVPEIDVRGLPEDRLRIVVSADGFQPAEIPVDEARLFGGGSLGVVELTSIPVVQLEVRDADSGAPIHGAVISWKVPVRIADSQWRTRGDRQTASTDSRGRAAIAVPVDLVYPTMTTALVSAPGYPVVKRMLRHTAGATSEIQEIRVSRGARVQVRVRDGDGDPVSGATVLYRTVVDQMDERFLLRDSEAQQADVLGRCTFLHVPPGTVQFSAYATNPDAEPLQSSGGSTFGQDDAVPLLEVRPGGSHSIELVVE